MAIIEAAFHAAPGEPQASVWLASRGAVVGFDRRGRPIVRKGMRRIEEIAAELRRRMPVARQDLPRSLEIVRRMRDRR